MSWVRRVRWRWVVIGAILWLIVASASSLEDGHSTMAQWGSGAAITLIVLAVLAAALRILGRATTTAVRQIMHLARINLRKTSDR